jgi:hypothetical protein
MEGNRMENNIYRLSIEIAGLSTDEAVETLIIRAENAEVAVDLAQQAVPDICRQTPEGVTGVGLWCDKRRWTLDELHPGGDQNALWAPRPGLGILPGTP